MPHPFLTDEQIDEWKEIQGNYTLTPNYFDLLRGLHHVILWYYKPSLWENYRFPQTFIDDFTRHFTFPTSQFVYLFLIAIFITLIRYVFERNLCRPFVNWFGLTSLNKKKFPESAWKCFFYSCTWSYCVYLLTYRYDYFFRPYDLWDDWAPKMNVPFDIQLMYFVQCGFYLHSIYATVFMDYKRKDFYIMLLHHIVTMTLILVSYATRYHKIGLLVLFVHDITDIWLELTKVLHYLSIQENGRESLFWESTATFSFIMFTFCWFLFRLYWFPLKVLYSTGVAVAYRAYDKGCGLYGFFNVLLWILLGLNLYWLFFILQFLFRVCSGTLNKLHDVRDEDDDDDDEQIERKKL